jgi:hypothetical protein
MSLWRYHAWLGLVSDICKYLSALIQLTIKNKSDMLPNIHKLCTQILQPTTGHWNHKSVSGYNCDTLQDIYYLQVVTICYRYVTQHTQSMYSYPTADDRSLKPSVGVWLQLWYVWRYLFLHNIWKLLLFTIWGLCTIYYLQVVTICYRHVGMR